MSDLDVTSLHEFVTDKLSGKIARHYKQLQIITEADLQSHVYRILSAFLRTKDNRSDFKILNEPFFKELKLFPDLVIFNSAKPWIVFEFKERSNVNKKFKDILQKEYRHLRREKNHFKSIQRLYLLYVAHIGTGEPQVIPHKEDRHSFYEIPIVLPCCYPSLDIKQWKLERKKWAKYRRETVVTIAPSLPSTIT